MEPLDAACCLPAHCCVLFLITLVRGKGPREQVTFMFIPLILLGRMMASVSSIMLPWPNIEGRERCSDTYMF